VKAAQRSIRLSGVDLVDGTPVLDVKPYVPDYDCPRAGDGSPGSAGTSGNRPDGVRVAVRELITSTRVGDGGLGEVLRAAGSACNLAEAGEGRVLGWFCPCGRA